MQWECKKFQFSLTSKKYFFAWLYLNPTNKAITSYQENGLLDAPKTVNRHWTSTYFYPYTMFERQQRETSKHHSCGFILSSCTCKHVTFLPWQLCPVQRLPTLASWLLFHLVFLCPSSPLSLPTKQRNCHWQIRTKNCTTTIALIVKSKFIYCFLTLPRA